MAGILLVDDHGIARNTVRQLLDAHALCICGEAADGQQALAQVKALNPELVLLDINMPVMNGIQAAFEIRRIAPSTKILFFTVQESTPEAAAAVRLLGADGFVNKSCAGTELIPTLKRLLRTD
jgi:DNA-binding NarL/FixJ family response regulator